MNLFPWKIDSWKINTKDTLFIMTKNPVLDLLIKLSPEKSILTKTLIINSLPIGFGTLVGINFTKMP